MAEALGAWHAASQEGCFSENLRVQLAFRDPDTLGMYTRHACSLNVAIAFI